MASKSLCLAASPSAGNTYLYPGYLRSRRLLCFLLLAVLGCAGALAQVKDYSSIVVFGDSLSDTGNVAHLTDSAYGLRIPGPVINYTDGRFTDGYDTLPAAQQYFGNWVEQFAASLPSHPEVIDSLDGGTNYAYGFATTGKGTSTLAFGTSNLFPVQIENIGQQITDYLATHPRINKQTLFIVWGGAIDVLYATSSKDVINAAFQQLLNIQRLIDAGATQFLVPNLPPLGLTPRLNGSPATSAAATAASALYNGYLKLGISLLQDLYRFRHLTVYQLDAFSLLSKIVASPAAFSIANASVPAEALPVDPDAYLFWDDIHPTTRGHNFLADTATGLLTH
jgi:phospholipase/lecithinase/hemolysin